MTQQPLTAKQHAFMHAYVHSGDLDQALDRAEVRGHWQDAFLRRLFDIGALVAVPAVQPDASPGTEVGALGVAVRALFDIEAMEAAQALAARRVRMLQRQRVREMTSTPAPGTPNPTPPQPDDGEHVVLVAHVVRGDDRDEAQDRLMAALVPTLERHGGLVDSWWIAEDDRRDRNDCDSAVFLADTDRQPERWLTACLEERA